MKTEEAKEYHKADHEPEQKVEAENIDKSTEEAKPDQEKSKKAKKTEKQEEKRSSIFDSIEGKKKAFSENLEQKYPKVSKGLNYFMDVWDEAFPNPEKQIAKRKELRKKQARE
jgi:hypothetical protein